MDLKEKTWGLIDEDRSRFAYPTERLNSIGQQRLIVRDVMHKAAACVFKQLAERLEKGL